MGVKQVVGSPEDPEVQHIAWALHTGRLDNPTSSASGDFSAVVGTFVPVQLNERQPDKVSYPRNTVKRGVVKNTDGFGLALHSGRYLERVVDLTGAR